MELVEERLVPIIRQLGAGLMSFMTGLCSVLFGHLSIFLEFQLILLITTQSTLQLHLLFCSLLQHITT